MAINFQLAIMFLYDHHFSADNIFLHDNLATDNIF